jgi:hypothetical protein
LGVFHDEVARDIAAGAALAAIDEHMHVAPVIVMDIEALEDQVAGLLGLPLYWPLPLAQCFLCF